MNTPSSPRDVSRYVTKTPAGTAFICEWYRVRGDRIALIRALFDARAFAPLFKG